MTTQAELYELLSCINGVKRVVLIERGPFMIEPIIYGDDDVTIAWIVNNNIPAGIHSVGNTSYTIDTATRKTIRFSRPRWWHRR